MSGTRPTPAEHHLGDRLAALVDGELGHDARERVLAHLATCARCKAEADAQRRVKSFFAESPPPPPPAGLLARLQGLPGGDGTDGDGPGGPGGLFGAGALGPGEPGIGPRPGTGPGPGGTAVGQERFAAGVFGVRPEGGFGYVPPGGGRTGSGFRIHEVGRAEAERSPWRGRRFAFAAASAVSFAAIALGGALPAATVVDARGDGSGNSVTPLRSPAGGQSASAAGTDNSRRRGGGTATGTTGTNAGPSARTATNTGTNPAGAGRAAERPGITLPASSRQVRP
ncbi:zf-HC2 domain-containing protein, partial [Streptomyces sp. TRM64462]|uniref:zf-HC2 domain-containing protein n=1 Tax=Streptomyces sp. TRM64462 TaxID=2741726 RepID=UPI001586F510